MITAQSNRTLVKRTWDKDYHTITDIDVITSPDQVDHNGCGEEYYYDGPDGKNLSSHEAIAYLSGHSK
jgi:hypothetical protein